MSWDMVFDDVSKNSSSLGQVYVLDNQLIF
jgi:hypothetical protein